MVISMLPPAATERSSERGVALVLAMFMVLMVSVVGASLVGVGRAQTMSSLNYRTMSQARYAAESGLHSAVNHLLYSYTAPGEDAGDILGNYDVTASPVEFNNAAVLLSSDDNVASNYPAVGAKPTAFRNQSTGTLVMNQTRVTYAARARLISMRQFQDAYAGIPVTIQTWEITGVGRMIGTAAADVEVSTMLERQTVPAFRYAAFATYDGCNALNVGGGATTNSYDSGVALVGGVPVTTNSGGNVGTNGNLSEIGNTTTINGTLSTPRSGVGNCTSNNVTALTVSGSATVTGGLVELPQPIAMPTPPAITPAPPTDNVNINKTTGCLPAVSYCTPSADGVTITPPSPTTVVSLGNLNIQGGAEIHFAPGIYEINSIKLTGNSKIIVDDGPAGPGAVIFRVAGESETTPIDLLGGTTVNTSYDPTHLQFVYGGTGNTKFSGSSTSSQLVYAPNANASIGGGSHFYGAIVSHKISDMGGTAIHYDRRLQRQAFTKGNPTLTTFSWSSF
jgi:hypothetical protein